MKILRFDPQVGVPIAQYRSRNVAAVHGIRTASFTHIVVMHLAAGGVLGYHPASMPQLFMVVAGEGWVRVEPGERTRIRAGEAAFWARDEWHESGTETGMSAVVVESDTLDPGQTMQEA